VLCQHAGRVIGDVGDREARKRADAREAKASAMIEVNRLAGECF
jgi:hypothetical protein